MSVQGQIASSSTATRTMSDTATATSTPAGDGSAAPRAPRHFRRGYRGRNPRNNANRQTPTQSQPQPQTESSSAVPAPPTSAPGTNTQHGQTTTPNPANASQSHRSRRGPRSGRRGRGQGQGQNGASDGGQGRDPGRGGDREQQVQGQLPSQPQNGRRKFEGRLTKSHRNSEDDTQDGQGEDTEDQGLRADAPAFVPGVSQPNGESSTATAAPPSKGKAKAKAPRTRPPKVTTKSEAEDITTRIHEDITHNLYECPICTIEIGRRSRVWSCGLCWTVFHLGCVKKWSKNEGAAAQDNARRAGEDGESNGPRAWRCPGCNLAQEIFPSSYSCWCEKEVDPRSPPGLPPHSCGQTCSRKRKGCPHPCDATCHAGPCAPCTAMGPTQDCFCGRNSSTKRCQDTDYERGWSCGEVCGDLLPCGEHTCARLCHEGLCGACEVKIDARCYCGKVQTEMLCSSKDEELDSELLHDQDVEEWTGCFNCGDACSRPFDCGIHFCQKTCHPQDAQATHCPRSPDVVSYCPCGKTPLADIPGYTPRESCDDPISNCLKACGKTLACGHACEKICHTGPCSPCMQTVSIDCRCGRNSFTTICHQGQAEPPQCFRVCKAGLHCGRHACAERCCPGEQKAIERQAMRRKLKPHLRPIDEDVEAEHICTRVCGRTLKCGRHTCPEICHKGPCNTCREAIFEEIPCNCGRSVLYPPLPCGTQPPPCSFQCERPKPCGHPQTAHNCHTDDEGCPKCPYLTEKTCLCGKRAMKNQPCWLTDARCGQICGEPLKCGSHFCQKNCHRPGECEDSAQPCQQGCGKTKTLCSHPCTEPCHAPYPCPEKTPCASRIMVTCDCGRLRQERRCNAAKAVASKGQLQQPQRLPAATPLTCDDECARLERNRSLAAALGVNINASTTIAQNALSSTNLPYSSETLDMYVQLSSSSPLSTLQTLESTLHTLATSTTNRSVRTQPAKSSLRAFIHSLAADYGFSSESFDPEPHRHVFILKPTTWTPPVFGLGNGVSAIGIAGMSVAECVKLRERHRFKEREAQRLAAAEAKAQRDAAKAQAGSEEGEGWAQVAASKRGTGVNNSARNTPTARTPTGFSGSGSLYAALAAMNDSDEVPASRKEKLVLRSGVGAAKQIRTPPAEIADSWEEEEEKEEEEERRARGESAEPEPEPEPANPAEATEAVEVSQAAEAVPETAPAAQEQVSHDTMINS
ncbi:hypothetical protein BJX63DRAFT_404870 [Aspergillus granulosus]|uniref:R3H domain-containing protein n=1 Tax=Aspergillus granulosus TaxID=176169 RepID=A0ABR4H2G1_9EURO